MPSASTLELFFFQCAVALALFLTVNVLGRNSPMFGYESLRMFEEPDEAAHFNFMFRVVTPIVLLITVAAACYYVGADTYTTNLHFSIPLYIAFRLAFNLIRGRALLLPWGRLVVQWAITCGLAWLVYHHLITRREYLFPDINTIGNEVWLAIAVYLYVLSGAVFKGNSSHLARSRRYALSRFRFLSGHFGELVKSAAGSKTWEALIFSVLIVEDFNRPKVFRFAERLAFRAGRAKTLGIMQVETGTLISDEESITLGVDRLKQLYAHRIGFDTWRIPKETAQWMTAEELKEKEESRLIHEVLVEYNPSGDYAREIEDVYYALRKACYPSGLPRLHPDVAPAP